MGRPPSQKETLEPSGKGTGGADLPDFADEEKLADFIFCIHNHQPVGNFDHVLESSYLKAYLPFLEAVSRRPWFKLSLHTSGFLLDWIVRERSEFIDIIKGLISEGRAEILGGGYYEPILSVIPERDRVGQIEMLSDRIEEVFGLRPRGIWLAERVWEPTLPASLREAGVEYVVLDDYHFIKAGLTSDELGGYYMTDDEGAAVKVFAGSERLRYLIPFKPAEEAGELIASTQVEAVVYADDGEKFGVWPRTHEWVYEKGWLEGFLDGVEKRLDRINPTTFSEFIDRNPPLGTVYLPTTSYMEMGGWTLPAESAWAFEKLEQKIATEKEGAGLKKFIKGGFWRNFFTKYPESNWMHKRMLMASRAVERADSIEATRLIYMAQSNDAFWHGIFGGLYLPHLRGAVYENIIAAEREAASGAVPDIMVETLDVDQDGSSEVILSSRDLKLFVKPSKGGRVEEIDFIPALINLSNTLTRRFEGYHHKLLDPPPVGEEALPIEGGPYEGGVESIHDMAVDQDEGLVELLTFDKEKRASFVERFFSASTTHSEFVERDYDELWDGSGVYESKVEGGGVDLERSGQLSGGALAVRKRIELTGDSSFEARYSFQAEGGEGVGDGSLVIGTELNIMLPASNGPATSYEFESDGAPFSAPFTESGEIEGLGRVTLIDEFTRVRVEIVPDGLDTLWYHPIVTVSQSESGFERIFQGVCLLFHAPLGVPKEASIKVTVKTLN